VSSDSTHHSYLQRRVVRSLLAIAALILIIGTPLVIFDELRFSLSQNLELIPGKSAEQLANGDDGAMLIVVPLGEYSGVGRERYGYRADYIARPTGNGMQLTDIETSELVDVPLTSLDFISNDPNGDHLLFRGPSTDDAGEETAVVLSTAENEVDVLPEGTLVPDLPGDWETETWEKVTGTCDRISPDSKFVACFNRADAASYLAGDWQIDVQLFGDFEVAEPVYRGLGFLLPSVGFAHNDMWLYFQNETGIFRIEIPASLQEHHPIATPADDEHNP
jgi:hypothetical protein